MTGFIPVYRHSLTKAMMYHEKDKWQKSYELNMSCAQEIDKAIYKNHHGHVLDDCAGEIVKKFGLERVSYVLANTVRMNKKRVAFSEEIIAWSEKENIPRDASRWHFAVVSDFGLTEQFINQVREIEQKQEA